MATFWGICFVVLLLLAVMDFYMLWKGRALDFKSVGGFSSFTYGCQGTFALLAAFLMAEDAFEGFSFSQAVKYAELVFLVLMSIGFFADWKNTKGANRNAERPDEN